MLQPIELLQSMFPIVTVNILSGKIQKADYIRVKKQSFVLQSKTNFWFLYETQYWAEMG